MNHSIHITAIVITLNEAENIGRCLRSMEGVADEIIVVDSFSIDETVDIAKRFGATVLKRGFEGYGQQRNWAMTQATHDHILTLDADECLSETLRNTLLKLKQHCPHDVYTMNRRNYFGEKWVRYCGWYPDKKMRFWKKSAARWNTDPVHEKVIVEKDAQTGHLNGDLLHYSFRHTTDPFLTVNKYSNIRVKERMAQHRTSGSWLNAGVRALFKFLKIYFLKLGLLDGREGFIISLVSGLRYFIEKNLFLRAKNNAVSDNNFYLLNKDNHPSGNIFRRVRYFQKHQVKTLVIQDPDHLKRSGLSAFFAGVPVVICDSDYIKSAKGSLVDIFLFTSVVTHISVRSEKALADLRKTKWLPVEKLSVLRWDGNPDALSSLIAGELQTDPSA